MRAAPGVAIAIAVAGMLGAPRAVVAAADLGLLSAIPADSVAVILGRPASTMSATQPASREGGDGHATLAAVLAVLNAAGALPVEGQVLADVVGCLPLLGAHEFALILLDVQGRAVPTTRPTTVRSVRLSRLRIALALRTQGHNEAVRAAVNRFIQRYTNNAVAVLAEREVFGERVQRLADERLPDWAVWEWGPAGDCFVVALGEGAWELVAGARRGSVPRLADVDWFREAHRQCAGRLATFQWCVDVEALQSRLSAAALHRVSAVLDALELSSIQRDYWAFGARGRMLECRRATVRDGRVQTAVYADGTLTADAEAAIPPAARSCAVLRVDAGWLFERLPAAYVASQSPRRQASLRRFWERVETESGLDVDRIIRACLGDEMLVFNYPAHPLGIPLAATLAVPIRDPESLQSAVDALCGASARVMRRRGSGLFRTSLRRAEDGVWYLQAGVAGPAWIVTERHLVMSWSPTALREALAAMGPGVRPR